MRAKPKRHYGGDIAAISIGDGQLWIECELTEPPSQKGRSVDVYFDPDDVTKLVVAARSAAIAARSKPIATESQWRNP